MGEENFLLDKEGKKLESRVVRTRMCRLRKKIERSTIVFFGGKR